MQRGSRTGLLRPEVELGPQGSLMVVGGLEAQLICHRALSAELGKSQAECRLTPEISGSFHGPLPENATCGEDKLAWELAPLYVRKTTMSERMSGLYLGLSL